MSWDNDARNILKAEIVRRGLTYERLAKLMSACGIHETARSITNKLSRGTFSFIFFLQAMQAMGARSVTIDLPIAGERQEIVQAPK